MAIIITVDFRDFVREFELSGRGRNFSHNGLRALFNYLEKLSEDTGSDYKLDVICLCCDYSEDTWQEIAHNYGIELSEFEGDEEKIEGVRDYLDNGTTIIGENNGVFVYATF